MTDWLKNEIRTGLQKLCCLGLAGQPDPEVLPGTLAAWMEVLTRNREYVEERDAPRFREAFSVLMGAVTRWPQPRHLLEVLPPPPALVAVGRERKFSDEVAAENLRKLGEMLGTALDGMTPSYKREAQS